MNEAINPRAVPGSNEAPDYGRQIVDQLSREYAEVDNSLTDLLNEARALPGEVNDDDAAGLYAKTIQRFRDLWKRLEAMRVKEKEPHLRAERAVDQFFGARQDKIEKRKTGDKNGAIDVLQQRLHIFNQRKRDEERRRREEAERIAREAEANARREREAAEQRLRDAAAAAARARKAENIAAHTKTAADAAAEAETARLAEQSAREAARDAATDATAKAADLVRTRHDTGVMTTMRQVPYVEITDSSKLDAVLLWPFVKDDHKLQALKAWAKITQHKKPMDGAIIEMRDETVVV